MMLENQKKQRGLLIISDTAMCYRDQKAYAFGPVVMELQFFLEHFDSITWIGREQIYNPTFYEVSSGVSLKMLPEVKGVGIKHKLGTLFQYPEMLRLLKHEIRKHAFVHVRAPSHPALVAMVLAKRYPLKRFWFKYAGSWVDPASRMYELQRRRLKRLPGHCVVTINGQWPDQAFNILAFENPCLTEVHREDGSRLLEVRVNEPSAKVDFCFVGGLNANKGIIPLLEAWQAIDHPRLGCLHIVGEGILQEEVETMSSLVNNAVKFHGIVSKEDVHKLYAQCEGIVLPTRTEGFPKVIGEAINYGCIPIVTDVSCISQYIQSKVNGFLLKEVNREEIKQGILEFLALDTISLNLYREYNYKMAGRFTYNYYLERTLKDVFPNLKTGE